METLTVPVNGVELHVERIGEGERLILVHGSWGDAGSWTPAVPALSEHYEVIAYDRRGHTRSTTADQPAVRLDHARDLVALIDALGGEPAHLVGNSGGASVVLTLAALFPDSARSVFAHEPAVFSLLADHPDPEVLAALAAGADAVEVVRGALESGDVETAVRHFLDDIALGPGAFDAFPPHRRDAFMTNAPSFLAELQDPDDETIDVDALASSSVPIMLSVGTESPITLIEATKTLASLVPHAELVVLEGADHVPYLSTTELYVDTVCAFHDRTTAKEARR